jgi:signal recognition particle receptor subunit beta
MTSQGRIVRTHESVDNGLTKPLKIVVTGPFSAGKTTLIQTISEIAIVGTERDVSDESSSIKESTTVAMDFGRITFPNGACLFLFGTPGQRRFEVMWEVLSDGMIGFIVLVNAADDRSLDEASHIFETFKKYADVPYVVGITHLDEAGSNPSETENAVRDKLELSAADKTIFCDVRDREDVKTLIIETLMGVMARLEAAEAASDGEPENARV